MSRKARFILAVAVMAGLFGYRYWRDHRAPANATQVQAAAGAATKPAKAMAAADAPPAQPRMYGRIAFTPCTLAPQFGPASVEAQCGSYEVAEDPAHPFDRGVRIGAGGGEELERAIATVGGQPDPVGEGPAAVDGETPGDVQNLMSPD